MALPDRWQRRDRTVFIAVCVITAAVYGSLLFAPSLTWDDDLNIFANPYFLSGHWSALWGTPHFGMYIPVTSTIWAWLFIIGHGAVWPFRVLNALLHLTNVLLFAALLRGLLRRMALESEIAFVLGVAIFALHPLQTATVSWISGGRDLAATSFAFAATGMFFSARRHRDVWATLLFIIALLCKPHVVAIPLAILSFTWFFDRGQLRRAAAIMTLWIALGLASAMVTAGAQSGMLTVQVPMAHRPVLALDALGFYLMKMVWPFPMASDYGRTPDRVWTHPAMMIPTLITLGIVLALVTWVARTRRPYALAIAWPLLFLPVLGLVTFPYQRISTVADHYNYIPLAVAAAVASIAVASVKWRMPAPIRVALVALMIGMAMGSWMRTRDWIGDDRFFAQMLARNPDSFSARINIAAIDCDRGDAKEGLAIIQPAAAAAPDDPAFLANETYCLFRAGRTGDALSRQSRLESVTVRDGLATNPGAAAILANSFAGAYVARGQTLQAFAWLCQAQAVAPGDADISGNLATARRDLHDHGLEVSCEGRVPWDQLARSVLSMKP